MISLRHLIITVSIVVLLLASAMHVTPQRHGGSQGKGKPPATGRPDQGAQAGNQGGMKSQKQIRATDQQRDQLRNCTNAANQLRDQARDMSRMASSSSLNTEQLRQQQDELRVRVQTMRQEHTGFMDGLDPEQKSQWQDRLRIMEQQRERVQEQLQAMDQEFGQVRPNGKNIAQHARKMERAMNEWQKQYRQMSSEASIKQ